MEVVKQDGNMDCGVSCLLSVIRHYGGNIPIEDLREKTKTNKSGVSAYQLVKTAEEIGFLSYGINGTLEDIDDSMLPLISHVVIDKTLKHFIVVYKIDRIKKKVVVMDPAKGKKTLSFAEFNLMTSNNYIYLKPIKTLPNVKIKHFIKRWMKVFTTNKKSYLVYIIILSIISFLCNIICGFHFSFLLNNSILYNIKDNAFKISFCLFLIYILKEVMIFLRNKTSAQFSLLFDEYITKKFYNKLLLLPYMYYKNRTTGEIISRMEDLGIVKQFLAKLLATIFTDVLVVLVFLIILFNSNKRVFWLLIFLSLILIVIDVSSNCCLKKRLNDYYYREDKINSLFIENMESISTIKNLHIESRVINKFYGEYKNLLEHSYLLNNIIVNKQLVKNFVSDSFYVLFFLISSISVIDKKISVAMIVILQNIINYFMESFNNILLLNSEYTQYKVSKKRIEDLFMIRGDNFCCADYFGKEKVNGTIKYHNLSYSFNSHKLFDNLNFVIRKKDKIFFYGDSGSGKSTLMKMLISYIEVPFGVISINGIDINHHHLGIIRNQIAYVGQNESLFRGTIEDNITLGKEISFEELEKVCNITCLNEVINSKELKLNTLIEDGGYNISGGERQRIILARVLLKNSDIYIFDEAFSQIDEEREKIIINNIFKYLESKTIIVISHRMSNKNLYNRVVKLVEGKIYEEVSK